MRPFFIVGAPRSGTTVLRNVLRSHPDLECPEETSFYRWDSPFGTKRFESTYRGDGNLIRHRQIDGYSEDEFWQIFREARSRRELQDRYMEGYLEKQGNPGATWFEKTPQNVYGLFRLIGDYPDSPIIHLHRNPLNVVASIRMGRSMGPEPVVGAANIWLESVSAATQAQSLLPDRIRTVSFEAFTAAPDRVIDEILEFVGQQPGRLDFPFRIDPPPERFPDVLSKPEIETVLRICGSTMKQLGYPATASENLERVRLHPPKTTLRRRVARFRRRLTGGNRPPDGLGEPPADRLLPTMSLYLFDALRSERLVFEEPLESLGPHLFRCGDTFLCVRYSTEEETRLIANLSNGSSPQKLIYLVDDHLEAIPDDQNLPEDYREKIGDFIDLRYPGILDRADEFVVSSPFLADHYRGRTGKPVTRLDPFWPVEWTPLSHQERNPGEPFQIAWNSTRSHRKDLESIRPAIETILKRHDYARLTVHCGKHIPGWLSSLPGVVNRAPLDWTVFREELQTSPAHAVLYPVLDTPVNRARSINKILEHAIAGAVGLYSDSVPFSDKLRSGENAFLLPGTPDQWVDTLEFLMAHPEKSREIAADGLRTAVELARRAKLDQIQFWKNRLPLQLDPAIAPDRANP